MKRILTNHFLLICMLSLVCFCACNDDEVYDIEGNEGFVYFNELKGFPRLMDEQSVVRTFADMTGKIEAKFPVKSTMPANQTTKVRIDVNNDFVDVYNEQNNKDYLALDKKFLKIENQELTIPQGEVKSTDSLRIYIPEENVEEIESGLYLIPIEIKETEGLPRTITSERNIYYLIANVQFQNIEYSSEWEMEGTLAKDKSKWSVRYESQNEVSGLENLIDGKTSTRITVPWKTGEYLELDLGESHSLVGLRMATWNAQYTWKNIRIFISEDGEQWENHGQATTSNSPGIYAVIKFMWPVTARYIRFVPATAPYNNNIYLSELDIYE